MTGQILAGIDPLSAVRYQIMIMYMWVASATLADVFVLLFIYKKFFTPAYQIRYNQIRNTAENR